MRTAALILAAVLLAGCGGRSLFGSSASPEDVDFARRYLALFPARSLASIEMGMDPSLRDPQMRLRILQMASAFPKAEPKSVQLVSSAVTRSGSTTTSSLSFEYEFPDRWVFANVVLERKGQAPVVRAVHVQAARESLEQMNRVTFSGKSWRHYAAAGSAIVIFAFVALTFALALRTPVPGMKWAWLLFILVGIVRVTFNWTTGTLAFAPMGVQFFGAAFSKPSAYAPLVITMAIPVGAIVFLVQRHEWLEEAREQRQPDVDAAP
jgi:hypothetical protein